MLAAIERCSSEVSCVTTPIAARRLSWVTRADVLAVDGDAALLRLVEAQQQADQCRLARTGAADQPHALAGMYGEAQPVEHRLRVARRS
jgi:hypothetical protein